MRSRKGMAVSNTGKPFDRDQRRRPETERLEEAARQSGVNCEVRFTPVGATIVAATYADFIIAKKAISPLTHQPVTRGL